jgi:hypothetical protein
LLELSPFLSYLAVEVMKSAVEQDLLTWDQWLGALKRLSGMLGLKFPLPNSMRYQRSRLSIPTNWWPIVRPILLNWLWKQLLFWRTVIVPIANYPICNIAFLARLRVLILICTQNGCYILVPSTVCIGPTNSFIGYFPL